jgi:hypothetical protein
MSTPQQAAEPRLDRCGPASSPECLELPRPVRLLRTAGLNLAESFGLPTAAFIFGEAFAGRDPGLWAMLGVIWLTAGVRRLLTGSIPGLAAISLIVLTLQTVVAIATGNLVIFLAHFPIGNLCLCLLFAWTARGRSPIAERLAGEVVGLRCPAIHQPRLNGFFRHVTWLWAGVFLTLAVSLGALLATVPVVTYVPIWAATTVVLVAAGIGVSVLWLRSVLRKFGIGFRFATVIS